MLIENPEALKSWLVVILEPLCDADSSALAKYVLALLKKDKPEKELKKVMIEQLDVFLGEETTPFVDRLFDAINTHEYLAPPPLSMILKKSEDSELDFPSIEEKPNFELLDIKTETVEEQNLIDIKNVYGPSLYPTTSVTNSCTEKSSSSPARNENKTKESHHQHHHQKSNDAVGTAENRSTQHAQSSTQRNDPPHSHSTHPQSQQAGHHSHHASGGPSAVGHHSHVRSASPPARANADKENQPRDSRRRRASLRSRSRSPRSRSRSNERFSRRSRSRDRRPNDREKNHRQFRNKSPPSNLDARYMGDRRRMMASSGGSDRRRGGGGGGSSNINRGGGNIVGERSPRFSGLVSGSSEAQDRKTRNVAQRVSHSRSRSPSIERNNQASGGRSKGSPANVNRQMERRASGERHQRQPQPHDQAQGDAKRQRCIDFEEKGYCVRGETCPWDHGNNPVVFEGVNDASILNMSLREYNPDVPDLWATTRTAPSNNMIAGNVHVGPGSINPFTGVVRPSAGGGAIMGAGPNNAVEFLRGTNVVPGGVAFRGAAPPMLPFGFNPPGGMQTHLQRELIPIPVLDATGTIQSDISVSGKRRYDNEDGIPMITDGPPKRKIPINSRLGPRVPSMQNNCSLELRKVPRGLNTITHLNNHFAKFGKIINIQISYDGDPEAAIITFSTHAEANVAYRSTEAVLNNRFIKVFWHNQDNPVLSSIPPMGNAEIGNRKNSHYQFNKTPVAPALATTSGSLDANGKVGNGTTAAGEALSNSESAATPGDGNETTTGVGATNITTAQSSSSIRMKNNMPRGANAAILRKKQEEQAKAVVHLANGLRKRKQELLQSYVKQMKSALELVERCEPNDPQRSKTLETIKVLQETIDKLRKEIAAEQEQVQAQIHNQQTPINVVAPSAKKTKEQQKKELLDIELELIAQQQEGNDTTAIQKRLEDLQRSLGIVPGSSGGASAMPSGGKSHFPVGRSVARVRPTLPEGSTRVDRRPKTIVVTGFASEEADFVLGHFKNFGEITKHDVDREIPQLILSYATRISAEQAVMRGKLFKDKRLQITWAPVITPTQKPAIQTSDISAQNEKNSNSDISKMDAITLGSNEMDSKESKAKDTLPELRLEDEEEEDESEDRSWRR